jgi:formylglycine-generating enzyme required for sulfatase activity
MKRKVFPVLSLSLAVVLLAVAAPNAPGQGARRSRPGRKPTATSAKPAPKPLPSANPQEQSLWDSIKDSHNPDDFHSYLDKYGETGKYAGTAHSCLARIEADQKAADARLRAVKIEFVWLEPGTFAMGTPYGELGRDSDEGPVHQVKITHGFFIGKYEITQAQWRAVMNRASFQFRGDENSPAENVTWDDVQEFIKRMNSRNDGYVYRLPTEAEWSYAASAGGHDHSGPTLDEMAWYGANAGGRTHPVGAKQPNAAGIYDMHGNVWEWVEDWYGKTYYRESPSTDPPGPATGEQRGMRGGGWNSVANLCRVGLRNGLAPGLRRADLGFRIVRVPVAATPTAATN